MWFASSGGDGGAPFGARRVRKEEKRVPHRAAHGVFQRTGDT